eukprot:TRINITY_DN2345_c1_g1_i1.p1 TRINITY_DN2345_c1_g1~~TRINITY_DN2345_c1_g1_i1.p1  ORF type:complete len:343 (-),score=41.49 TRINITY_DN2345_c1_g1_i1:302-1330(-)
MFRKKTESSGNEKVKAPPVGDKTLTSCCMEDFDMGVILGTGSFGRVMLGTHKKTGVVCAIKALSKATLVKNGQVEHLKHEVQILKLIEHPFLVSQRGLFQDNHYIYLVLEYVNGGEFFTHLRARGRLSEDTARFYAAEVVLGLEYLHKQNIAYRDLKPENMLLDSKGHLKITDFGFAKHVPKRTFTLCGTPDYLAPEIILNKGHSKAVDWWALGVLIFEMVAGYPPFYDDDPVRTYKKIITMKYEFPKHFSSPIRDLVNKLLQADLTRRLGNLANAAVDIKKHPWFKGINWESLVRMTSNGPIRPKVKSADDTSNFDDYSSLGPLKPGPELKPSQQALFKEF